MFKKVFIFAVGAALGGAASYFYFAKKLKKESEIYIQKEIDSMKAEIAKREAACDKRDEDYNAKVAQEIEEKMAIDLPFVQDFSSEKETAQNIVNYSSYA